MSETMETKKKSKVKQFFGQFAEKEFWKELMETAAREAIRAMMLAFAGAVTGHIHRRFAGALDYYAPNNQQNNHTNSSQAATKAFGVQDTTDYSRKPYTPSYLPSNPSAGSATFPGFGSR